MAIFERINRIIKSNVNWLLDLVEPAEKELESKIKELEEVIQEGRESAAMYGSAYKRIAGELVELENRMDMLVSDATTALAGGDEAHARKLLEEKVRVDQKIAQLAPSVDKGRKSYELLNDNIHKLQDQLKQANLKLRNLRARNDIAQAQNEFEKKLGHSGVSDFGFERLEDEVLTKEAEVEVRGQMRGDSLSDRDLQERSRELQVEAELQELRAKLENK